MSFTDLLKRKIEERREGCSDFVQTAMDADARFRQRTAPLAAALTAIVEALAADPMFANAMRRPDIIVKRDDSDGLTRSLTFKGCAADIGVRVDADRSSHMRIYLNFDARQALQSGMTYEAKPISGDPSGIDEFIACIRDHLGDLLADISFSPAAHLLQPEPDKLAV